MARFEHIPLEFLQTFVRIAELDGDATSAAHELGISQPTISKRLAALRRATSDPDGQPWLLLKGKRWLVTPEGQRVRGVVTDLVQRYKEMEQFVAGNQQSQTVISLACGQDAASSFVKTAIERFLKQQPNCRVRVSTPRGKSRIEGVAGGQFDMAIVTDSPSTIRRIARVDLYIETLFEDSFVLVANPTAKSDWGKHWSTLLKESTERSISAKELIGLPFILPEPDSSRRKQFDEWMYRATGQPVAVIIETGGWQNILNYAASGLGIGLVTQTALDGFTERQPVKLDSRVLQKKEFPPDAVRLIARKVHGKDESDLSPVASELRSQLILKQ